MARTRLTKDERERRRKERLELLDQAIDALAGDDGWQRWLKVRRAFHHYSWRNQLLIALQRPDTVRVAGYRRWQQLGYQVRKGSKAIWILGPAFREVEDEATGEKVTLRRFTPVSVFAFEDCELLEGHEPLPVEPPMVWPAGDELTAALDALLAAAVTELGVVAVGRVGASELGQARGRYMVRDKRIELLDCVAVNESFAVLVHELAHHLVRVSPHLPTMTYAQEEVLVESVAYCVCQTAGLNVADSSARYISAWRGDDAPGPAQLVAAVDDLATTIELAAGLAVDSPQEVAA